MGTAFHQNLEVVKKDVIFKENVKKELESEIKKEADSTKKSFLELELSEIEQEITVKKYMLKSLITRVEEYKGNFIKLKKEYHNNHKRLLILAKEYSTDSRLPEGLKTQLKLMLKNKLQVKSIEAKVDLYSALKAAVNLCENYLSQNINEY
jgi:predicted RNase H-like nuclease (RuvC/YqgF family)